MVRRLPPVEHPDQLCEGCLVGKYFRKPFPKESSSRAKKQLELIHADVCGPIKQTSLGKNKYFLNPKYFLKQKSEAFDVFKKFKVVVEKDSSLQIKAMRTDRGGEFTSRENFVKKAEFDGY